MNSERSFCHKMDAFVGPSSTDEGRAVDTGRTRRSRRREMRHPGSRTLMQLTREIFFLKVFSHIPDTTSED
jgi:hypothetical protein